MNKTDFSIRNEVEVIAKEILNLNLTTEQINQVLSEIEQYDTFLTVVSLFVFKGIQDTGIEVDKEELEHQLRACRSMINYNDLNGD